jgi:hypothetical protein
MNLLGFPAGPERKKMKYKPQTEFYTTEDGSLVYNLKQDGWNRGEPRMVNDVWIPINAPTEHRREIANMVMNGLNLHFKPNASVSIPGGGPGYAPRECSASSCCGAGVTVAGGSEGTNWYECVSCGNPCDLVPVHRDQNGGVDRPTMAGKEAGQ